MTKEELLKLKKDVLNLKKVMEFEKMLPNMSAYEFLVDSNKDRLNEVAINYLGRTYTYKELFDKIDDFAKGLYNNGVRPGDTVALGMLSTPEAIISFYALNKIGALTYMVNATHELNGIKEELLDSKAELLITNTIFYDKNFKEVVDQTNIKKVVVSALDEDFPKGFVMDKVMFKVVETLKKIGSAVSKDEKCTSWSSILKEGKNLDIEIKPFYEPHTGIAVASTSGSTGKPKRPMVTNENINAMAIQLGMTAGDAIAPNDSILTTLPIWIFYSLFNSIHEPLCLGVTVDLDPLFNSKRVDKRLDQYRFNHWNTIPAYIEDFVNCRRVKNKDLSHLKLVTTGGDYRPPKLKALAEKKLKENNSDIEIGQGYGASECGGCFGFTSEENMAPESIGKPLIGNAYKILNVDTHEECGPNESGELFLYSPTMMKEYFGDEEATKKAFIYDENGTKWYRTEDMAHYDEKGQMFIDGRLRRIEISRDANGVPTKVFPDKVKQVVSLHPAVDRCEIVMVDDTKRITRPIAYVILHEGIVLDSDLIRDINDLCVMNNVESYIIPTEYKQLKEIPMTPSLKVDFNKLKEMYEQEYKSKQKTLFKLNTKKS